MCAQSIRLAIQPTTNQQLINQGPRLVALNLPPQNPPHVQLQVRATPQQSHQQRSVHQPIQLQVGPNPSPRQQKTGTYHITASEYQRYKSTREHIYNITDAYIGSDEQMPRLERVLNLETMTFQEEEVHLPEGVENIYVEISSNAGDNVARSIRHGVDPGEVTILMNHEMISVRNGGISIPVEIHPHEKMWAPQLIFGVLHSSSNYDKNKVRTECGRNGYGAKLTNIFSKEFMVTIGDPNNKRWYRQIWNENMTVVSDPEIKENYEGESFVEIIYKMDFKRFGYEKYPDEAFRLFARHAADMSFSGKVPVSFNGVKMNVQNATDYAKLYLGEEAIKKSIVYYQWAPGVKTQTKKNGVVVSLDKGVVPVVEICAVDTPDAAVNVSFVNGKWTRNGGVHADAAFKAVSKGLLETVNGGKKAKKKGRSAKLNMGDVKRHVSLFISCWLDDPKFDNQYKTALKSPSPKIVIDDKILQPIMKWDLVNRLYAELEAKHFRLSKSSDGKKRKYLTDLKGEDANDAGTANAINCTLYVTEGKSAMGFAVKMLSLFEKGRDFIGLLPLKGKPLNVMNAPPMQIAENTEILELKKMLGLRERVNYLEDENFKNLRYGHLMILADADTDGKHILGLVLNMFHCKYPSLLARGYVKYLRTKIIDVKKGNQIIKFYSNHEYEKWKAATPNWNSWDHAYFKGLGSSEDSDIEEEFRAPKIVQCFYDDLAPMAMQLAFHEKLADQRKEWIRNWQPDFRVEEMQMQPISAFINHEFIQFSIADVARSIPRFMDGLKQVQRKAIWGSMKKWKGSAGSKKAAKIKVGNLASYVSEKTEYHHGPKSLCDAIVNMIHDFTGSNNLPYFCANGQFGCVDPKTPILLWSGDIIKAENVKVGHELIGDDGQKRIVNHVVSGTDDMYEISQACGDSYVVNSIHILTLMVTLHKKISWKDSSKSWIMSYYDHESKRVQTKTIRTSELNTKCDHHHNKSNVTKEEGYKRMKEFSNTIPDNNIVDIPLNEYLQLSQNQKNFMDGFVNYTPIQWDKQDVPIDPYIFGSWLGDGDSTVDPEILKANGLYKNKHVPYCYIKNDEQTRLEVLAGFIDTDGTVRKHSNEKGYYVEISQKDEIHGHLLDSTKLIASSLGFKTNIYTHSTGMKTLIISGQDLHRIPTILPHKKIPKNVLASNPYVSKISVKHVGRGKYCGWHIDGNERFLLGDFTVTHNTRNMLGKDASDARYTKTRPQWWWKYIFKSEDNPLLKMVVDEGKVCEPVSFLPILPLHLINGVSGIGTGHSTFIPNHDPLDICQWLTSKIKGYPLPPVLPWYRDFKGDIKLAQRGNRKRQQKPETPQQVVSPVPETGTVTLTIGRPPVKAQHTQPTQPTQPVGPAPPTHEEIVGETDGDNEDEDDLLDGDAVAMTNRTKYTMITTGAFEVSGKVRKKVIVTELPIGRSMHDYGKWLTQQREQKLISGYSNYSKANVVHFEITGMKNTPNHKNLRLTRSYGMSNMVLLDMDNRPIKYDSTVDILESFYALRLPYYQMRKDNILKEMQDKIDLLNSKIRFIIAVIHGYNLIKANPTITIDQAVEQGGILSLGLSKKDIISQMQRLGFADNLLKKVSLYQCTLEELQCIRENLQKMLNEKAAVEQIPPQQMWQSDIDEFVAAYCREYKCKPTVKRNVALAIVNTK